MKDLEYYQISGEFNLNMTAGVNDESDLPDMRKLKDILETRFNEVVENTLLEYTGNTYEEMYTVLSDTLYKERDYENE